MPAGLRRVAFLGTPGFAVPILESICRVANVVLVVTQPDRRRGRGRKIAPSEVKLAALERGIEILQPEIVKGKRFAQRIAEYGVDFIVTAAFGRVLGPSLLDVPRFAAMNVHASLLPRHRGAAPANWAIMRGDKVSGISIMRMETGLDTGPVYCSKKTNILPDDTAGSLLARLSKLGGEAIEEAITGFETLQPVQQDEAGATWAPMLSKSDGRIDWNSDAVGLERLVRGVNPWPIATTSMSGNVLKVHRSSVLESGNAQEEPGTVLGVSNAGIDVACGSGVLRLLTVQAAGKKQMDARDFLSGTAIPVGTLLGEDSSGTDA